MRILGRIRDYLNLVRFEHTIFALPFAYIGALFAWRMLVPDMNFMTYPEHSYEALSYYFTYRHFSDWLPPVQPLIWITLAVIGARTAAMALNRVIDAKMDAVNPRTAKREIPTGKVSVWEAAVLAAVGGVVLVVATAKLSTHLLVFLPIPALFLLTYSYTKRFTRWCHVILGATDGFAPLGGALALCFYVMPFSPVQFPPEPPPTDVYFESRAEIMFKHLFGDPHVLLLGALLFVAVTLWVAGFDIYYSIQDIEFDRANKVFSLPSTWGIKPSLIAALLMHLGTVALLWWAGALAHLNSIYVIGIAIALVTLVIENVMVWRSRALIGAAFFTANGILSIVFLVLTVVSLATSGFPPSKPGFLM